MNECIFRMASQKVTTQLDLGQPKHPHGDMVNDIQYGHKMRGAENKETGLIINGYKYEKL